MYYVFSALIGGILGYAVSYLPNPFKATGVGAVHVAKMHGGSIVRQRDGTFAFISNGLTSEQLKEVMAVLGGD